VTSDTGNTAAEALAWPSSAQRKPSITPTIGLSAYNGRQAAGTSDDA